MKKFYLIVVLFLLSVSCVAAKTDVSLTTNSKIEEQFTVNTGKEKPAPTPKPTVNPEYLKNYVETLQEGERERGMGTFLSLQILWIMKGNLCRM
jgi:hypothetical protein